MCLSLKLVEEIGIPVPNVVRCIFIDALDCNRPGRKCSVGIGVAKYLLTLEVIGSITGCTSINMAYNGRIHECSISSHHQSLDYKKDECEKVERNRKR